MTTVEFWGDGNTESPIAVYSLSAVPRTGDGVTLAEFEWQVRDVLGVAWKVDNRGVCCVRVVLNEPATPTRRPH